jgi:hypothetical protein
VEEEGEGLESELKERYLPNCTIVWSSLFSKAWKNYHTWIHRNLIAHILAHGSCVDFFQPFSLEHTSTWCMYVDTLLILLLPIFLVKRL